ncbi:hypothetical protein HanIR_Chr05g0245321 [Helianthus annuus]|nr:hypothetical protein HanIR_Chr05g0245321 [Helianthus annuus]
MLGHTVNRCFEIVGYPQGFKRRTSNQLGKSSSLNNKSNMVASTSSMPFTSEQITKLLNLVNDKSGTEQQSGNMGGESTVFDKRSSMSGVYGNFVSCSSMTDFGFNYNWVIDSGANQHMVMINKDMYNCVDVSGFDIKVCHPNGTCAKVTKIGDIKLANGVVLCDVFYVPEYNVNLMSVFKLAKDNKLSVVFDEDTCSIQDLKSRKVLVTGRQDNGLLGHPFDEESG